MGFLSKAWDGIKKGTKNIWKGIKKTTKKVFKKTKEYWDKFRKSAVGKVIMVAAAIYFGGVALGAWGGSGSTAMLAADAAAATTEAAAIGSQAGLAGLAPEAMSFTAAETAAAASQGAIASQTAAAAELAALGGSAGAASIPVEATSMAGAAGSKAGAAAATEQGLIGKGLSWAAANPELTIAGGQALSAAMADDPYDTWRQEQEYLRNKSNVAGIYGDGGGSPIGMGLIRKAQSDDLYTPTYNTGG